LDEVQQKFVDLIEGRKAEALAQSTKIRAVKAAVVKHPKKNKSKGFKATGNSKKKWDGKRKASQVGEKLTNEEIVLLKI
jgi:deoxyxylulose-5-phosphate synthase